MSTNTYLVAHPQKEIFEIGGSWMHHFSEYALLDREILIQKLCEFVRCEKPYDNAYKKNHGFSRGMNCTNYFDDKTKSYYIYVQ